jgi:hypothetical protein
VVPELNTKHVCTSLLDFCVVSMKNKMKASVYSIEIMSRFEKPVSSCDGIMDVLENYRLIHCSPKCLLAGP